MFCQGPNKRGQEWLVQEVINLKCYLSSQYWLEIPSRQFLCTAQHLDQWHFKASCFHSYPKMPLQYLLWLVEEFTHEENLVRRVEHKKVGDLLQGWRRKNVWEKKIPCVQLPSPAGSPARLCQWAQGRWTSPPPSWSRRWSAPGCRGQKSLSSLGLLQASRTRCPLAPREPGWNNSDQMNSLLIHV